MFIEYDSYCSANCRNSGDCNCPKPEKTQTKEFRRFVDIMKKRLPSVVVLPEKQELLVRLLERCCDLRNKDGCAVIAAAVDIAILAFQISSYDELRSWFRG